MIYCYPSKGPIQTWPLPAGTLSNESWVCHVSFCPVTPFPTIFLATYCHPFSDRVLFVTLLNSLQHIKLSSEFLIPQGGLLYSSSPFQRSQSWSITWHSESNSSMHYSIVLSRNNSVVAPTRALTTLSDVSSSPNKDPRYLKCDGTSHHPPIDV